MASPLVNARDFLIDFGFFDIVLPFIFVFTLSFAIFEKTKIFGSEKDTKSVSSMISFAIALMFVATPKLVDAVALSMPRVIVMIIGIMCFLMMVGFLSSGQWDGIKKPWVLGLFGSGVFIGVALIFIDSLGYWNEFFGGSGKIGNILTNETVIYTALLLAIMAGAVTFVMLSGKNNGNGSSRGNIPATGSSKN